MKRTCYIQCKGNDVAPHNWINYTTDGINRLYYIKSGTGGYVSNGENVPFRQGMLYFIPFYSGIYTYSDNGDRLVHSYVNFKITPPIVSQKVFCIDPNKSEALLAALEMFNTLCKRPFLARLQTKPLSTEEEQELNLLKALTIYFAESAINEYPDRLINDDRMVQALNIIHSDSRARLTVSEIAAKCFMSVDGFIRKFTRQIGESPYSYIKKLKIQTALVMRAEGATLEEAAEACGYSSASSLLHAMSSDNSNTHRIVKK